MKALDILKHIAETNQSSVYGMNGDMIVAKFEIDAAIAELEALQAYKTCDGCKYDNDGYCTKYYNDKYGRVDCSRLTEDRYEPKDEND